MLRVALGAVLFLFVWSNQPAAAQTPEASSRYAPPGAQAPHEGYARDIQVDDIPAPSPPPFVEQAYVEQGRIEAPQPGASGQVIQQSFEQPIAQTHEQPAAALRTAGETSRPVADGALPLPARKQDKEATPATDADASGRGGMPSLTTVISSLAIVVGLFLLMAWLLRRAQPRGSAVLPREVLEMLGRVPMPGKQQMQLLRLGRKLVLISVSPAGVETISEVTDPAEVDRIAGMCLEPNAQSATATFREVISELGSSKRKKRSPRA
jgi:flagellar protein FliO/FliZ